MDWTTIISAAIAAISAGGGIGIFFDRKHKKRAAELANESTVSSQWKELFERSEKKWMTKATKSRGFIKRSATCALNSTGWHRKRPCLLCTSAAR